MNVSPANASQMTTPRDPARAASASSSQVSSSAPWHRTRQYVRSNDSTREDPIHCTGRLQTAHIGRSSSRVGGSPADQAFRTATQESAERYRAARTACRTKPSAERSACVSAARSELKRARLEAKAVPDAAHEKAR